MTRFEKDLLTAREDAAELIQILRERKAELDKVYKKGLKERNGFRVQCLAQEYARLKAQYDELEAYI